MKWKAKNDTCGVIGEGFIKASDFTQDHEDALLERAKLRGIDENVFMLGAGYVPNSSNQLEIVEQPKKSSKR